MMKISMREDRLICLNGPSDIIRMILLILRVTWKFAVYVNVLCDIKYGTILRNFILLVKLAYFYYKLCSIKFSK